MENNNYRNFNNCVGNNCENEVLFDHGPEPLITNVEAISRINKNYRTVIWTGEYLQLVVMSIPVGGEIGMEVHPDTDQYIRIEEGFAIVEMGKQKDRLNIRQRVSKNSGILVPAGTWHNIINIGRTPLKVSTVYGPPHHPFGTIHKTKADAKENERETYTHTPVAEKSEENDNS